MARFTSPFTATSTAAEVLDGVDLHGRLAVVTGASSGIGVETARALAGAGAHVVLAVRDMAAGRRAAEGIAMKTPAQGAATSVLAAASPLLTGVGGLYLEDCEEAEAVPKIVNGTHGVRPYALDSENATRLWDVSLELLRST